MFNCIWLGEQPPRKNVHTQGDVPISSTHVITSTELYLVSTQMIHDLIMIDHAITPAPPVWLRPCH